MGTAEDVIYRQAGQVLNCIPEDDRQIVAGYIKLREEEAVRVAKLRGNVLVPSLWVLVVGVGLAVGIPAGLGVARAFANNEQLMDVREDMKKVQERCIEKVICDCESAP